MDDFINAYFGEEDNSVQNLVSIASSDRAAEQIKYKDHFKVFKVEDGEKQKQKESS